jgi:hypothetical protein
MTSWDVSARLRRGQKDSIRSHFYLEFRYALKTKRPVSKIARR